MRGAIWALILAFAVVPVSYALGPDVEYDVFGPYAPIYNMELNTTIISLDADALRPYDLHRYIVDGRIIVSDGTIPVQGIRDIRLSSHDISYPLEAANMDIVTGALGAHENYNATGRGIVVAVVDTGTDFSNPDMADIVARDANNHPLMLDPDGQGIILTNNTFTAFIDRNGVLRNSLNHTVYVNDTGVYLSIARDGEGTELSVYNPLYPLLGDAPVLTGIMYTDYKIGHDGSDYIPSRSGVYHLGVSIQINQMIMQTVPVLVTDPNEAGVYDTIYVDMATSWQSFTNADSLDFDFTDNAPITMGSGNEMFVYDSNGDGVIDYTAGMLGAHVLDVYGIFGETTPDGYISGAVNATLLEPVDPDGNHLGVMTDMHGHGTATAGLVASQGDTTYRIYNDTRTYTITGTAPGATIIPVKALWYGSVEYGWMWAAGMDNNGTGWTYSGDHRADIISNSWGVPTFPRLDEVPGYDYLSLLSDVLSVPGSVDDLYPGTLMVNSAGNSGHGYGSMSLPGASSLAVTVGATSNSGYTAHGPFAEQPRFGNSTEHYGHLMQFTSRGPGALGVVKPDILSLGGYGFAPASMMQTSDEYYEPFSAFGGTSMAAPLVAGGAAVVAAELQSAGISYDPFTIKNILMSTASDAGNDPMAQGAGRLDIGAAVEYVRGAGPFVVTNDASYVNLRGILSGALASLNSTQLGLSDVYMPTKTYDVMSWFAGQLEPGTTTSTTFTIHNPGTSPMDVQIMPQTLRELERYESSRTTIPRQQDSMLNDTGVYVPNYIRLADAREPNSLEDLFATYNIPESDMLIVQLNFDFDAFMNMSAPVYADDFTIASLYMYDWDDSNSDNVVDYGELALVNRAGSWGTGQELRISYPHKIFDGVPVLGVYPVPVQASYWTGITDRNSTAMSYTMTVSYYDYKPWDAVWTDSSVITVPPASSAQVRATLSVPPDTMSGVQQGFVRFQSSNHDVNVPVSYAVVPHLKDTMILADGDGAAPFPTGMVQGSFDMSGRYMSGEWRQHYMYVPEGVETAIVEMSWLSNNTHMGVFVADPNGKIIQTNTDPGVFGDLISWASSDWLGYSAFGEGGGFYPVSNWNDTTTILSVSTPDPGVYTILSHVSLHGGESVYEPMRVFVRFS